MHGSSLVTSPTTKGVILIGIGAGGNINGQKLGYSLLHELSGDSEDNLSWSKLDRKLDSAEFACIFPYKLIANYWSYSKELKLLSVLCGIGVKVRNKKMDFNTGGTCHWVEQWTLRLKIYDFVLFG